MRSSSVAINRRLVRGVLPVIATAVAMIGTGVVWASLTGGGEDAKPPYEVGRYGTERGCVIALPAGMRGVRSAQYDRTGDRLLVEAYADSPEDRCFTAWGWWIREQATGEYSLVHENLKSTERIFRATLCPDGRWVAALHGEYPPEVLTEEDVAATSKRWVVMSLDGREMDAIESQTDRQRGTSWQPAGASYAWLDASNIVSVLPSDADVDMSWSHRIGTLEVHRGETRQAVDEEPGAGVSWIRRVADGRFIYCVETADSMEHQMSTARPDKGRTNRGLALRLCDATGPTASIRTLPISASQADLRRGVLSPNERFYAFLKKSIVILDLESGGARYLKGEVVDLLQWHPDGTRLLGMMNPSYPQDPDGVLVEIPVGDLVAESEQADGPAGGAGSTSGGS